MEAEWEVELGGFALTVRQEITDLSTLKAVAEQLKAAGASARKYSRGFGGKNGDKEPESWARASQLRAFSYGEGKHAIEFALEPDAGSFEMRKAVAWSPDSLLPSLPPPLAAVIQSAWAENSKRGKECAIAQLGIEVGFFKDGDNLKAVAVRMQQTSAAVPADGRLHLVEIPPNGTGSTRPAARPEV